jgi:FlaA1/EpsC-like NDP-sugar epimerase/lipopolysaccharide/colanic/teichoic acid biosynthesis glycosyltransferase
MKRALDVAVAGGCLVLLSPLILACAIAVKISSAGPVFYAGQRVGRGGREFHIHKLRTMRADNVPGSPLTSIGDPRVTPVGRFLRRAKLDELPQLWDVLRGEMSLVGPRPEAPEFVADYTEEQRRVLTVRPGITSPASIAYRNEDILLPPRSAAETYTRTVLPTKLAMDLAYIDRRSLLGDFGILASTLGVVATGGRGGGSARRFLRRHVPWVAVDALIVAAAFGLAYLLRFLDTPFPAQESPTTLLLAVIPLAALYSLINMAYRLDRREWRYATAAEVRAIAVSAATSTAVAIAFDTLLGLRDQRPVPLSVVLIGGFFSLSGFVGVRYRSRLLRGVSQTRFRGRRTGAVRTLICGAGEAGQLLAYRLITVNGGRDYDVVGFVDENLQKLGKSIHDVRVLGRASDLPRLVARDNIELIVLALDSPGGEQTREVLTAAQGTSARIKIVPGLDDWLNDEARLPLREIRAEDLLGRPTARLDVDAGKRVITGRTVLVTGASGSIGSELCRQIAAFSPKILVALDNNESGLFDLNIEFAASFPGVRVMGVVADVARPASIARAFATYSPEVIFHVAAYKHVPLMEEHPEEALRVNVLGTWTVLEAARVAGAAQLVLVSTDKAVNPSSVMGSTKRLAELLVASDPPPGEGPRLTCTAVRFGNVLGSRGSVVPTFRRQIDAGGPITVTHPEMTRYFMHIAEAAALIVEAADLTGGNDLFMLEMGDSIRVDDLARKMIRMRGLRPDIDIQVVYTGARPGEKLEEELTTDLEASIATSHPLIYRVSPGQPLTRGEAEGVMAEIAEVIASGSRDGALDALRRLSQRGVERASRPRDPAGSLDSETPNDLDLRGPGTAVTS